jgi:P4 family phage/plasmid primase-like protien
MIQVRLVRFKDTPTKDKNGNVVLDKAGKPKFDKFDCAVPGGGVNAESVDYLFKHIDEVVNQIPENMRWNCYYTVGHMPEEHDGKKRRWARQDVFAFDIDNVTYDSDTELPSLLYYEAIKEATGLNLNKCVVIATGNGIQVVFKPKGFLVTDRDWFSKNKKYYNAVLAKISEALKKYSLAGEPDPIICSPNWLLRLPCTSNIKPDKPARIAKLIKNNLEEQEWNLIQASGLPEVEEGRDAIHKNAVKNMKLDGLSVESGCEFLKWCRSNQNQVSEPQWYAMLSVVGRLPGGEIKAHEYSKESRQYTEHETSSKLDHALKSSGPRTCENISTLWPGCSGCSNYQKVSSPVFIKGPDFISTEGCGFHKAKLGKGGQIIHVPQYLDLLKYYGKQHPFVNVNGKLHYIYTGTKWQKVSDALIGEFAQNHFDPSCDNQKAAEFKGLVFRSNNESPGFFVRNSKNKINLLNATYDVDTLSILEGGQKPENGFLWNLPLNYDPLAECPLFEKFLDDFTCSDQSLKDILQEYMGYIMSGCFPKAQKFLTLVGEGSNGKSTFIEIMQDLLGGCPNDGDENSITAFSSLGLKQLGQQFERRLLLGARLNVIDESETYLESGIWEKLKNMVTGGVINAAFKGKDAFQFVCMTKFILLVNEIPAGANPNKGFYRRFLIVPCNATFEGKKVDRNIKDKIVAEELAGIFNFAMQGFARLRENDWQFTKSAVVEESLAEYQKESNGVHLWCDENIQFDTPHTLEQSAWHAIDKDGQVVANIPAMRKRFNMWREDRGEKELSEVTFGKRLKVWLKEQDYAYDNMQRVVRIDGKNTRILSKVWTKNLEEPKF